RTNERNSVFYVPRDQPEARCRPELEFSHHCIQGSTIREISSETQLSRKSSINSLYGYMAERDESAASNSSYLVHQQQDRMEKTITALCRQQELALQLAKADLLNTSSLGRQQILPINQFKTDPVKADVGGSSLCLGTNTGTLVCCDHKTNTLGDSRT
ncbi:hypothetical protein OTU49_012139, partial [Cherax quadricarinatus]